MQPGGQTNIPLSAGFFLPKKMKVEKDGEGSATKGRHHLRKNFYAYTSEAFQVPLKAPWAPDVLI